MEIFQTIWTALTTENVKLTAIIGMPTVFMEIYISMLIFTTILNIEATKKQKRLYVLIMSLLVILNRLFIPAPYNTFVNVLILFLGNILILKSNLFKAIISLFIPFITTIIVESFIARIYYLILKSDYTDGINVPIKRLFISCFVYLTDYFIYLLIKHFKFNFSILEVFNKKNKLLLSLTIIFGIILIATQLYTTFFYSSVLPLFIILLSICSLLAYFLVSMYTIFTVSKLETTSTNLEEAKLYNKTLQILHDNIRAFKHDFWNIVQGIGGYVGRNDMEGLKEYYSKLVEDCQQVNNLTALSPNVVNNPAIYNVLANKYHMADELGIKINLEVFMDLNQLNINSYEFTRILGILMNNAIEASKECDKKVINVAFRKDKRKHMQLLIVENTYMDKSVDTEKIYEKGYSTKQGNSGIGLWEVRQIMKKHNNLNLYTTKTDEYFSQQFEIYY